ncbi:sulfotransferase domain-containing protein [Paenibacillus sp. IB182496]|uniref:Sulfotransferase domain-containing protein n=1 Tax=Paenibacillus sabuli TaxID=2772509 RepID=A0A927BVV8_9BACL|nr:sulfotransferase domain-containing protein [Paenibacillus sabuli]MBD2846429.1 sulfotransferase domain-containing protein [Paenibacillus sabuli]
MQTLPPLLLNSIPKSGTHLMKQALTGIPNISTEAKNEFYEGYRKDDAANYARLAQLPPGQFATGHVYYSPEWRSMLGTLGIKQVFVIRDPRDIVVSYVHFIVYKYPYHPLVHHLRQELKTPKQRYLAIINGVKNGRYNYPNFGQWLDPFLGWAWEQHTLRIAYEQLVRSPQSRRQTLSAVLDYWTNNRLEPHVQAEWLNRMEQNIDPRRSLTFRSGQIGDWRSAFDPEVKAAFKRVAGLRLIQLGYERNLNW